MKTIIIKTANEEIYNAFNNDLLTPLKEDLKANPEDGHVVETDDTVTITITAMPYEE